MSLNPIVETAPRGSRLAERSFPRTISFSLGGLLREGIGFLSSLKLTVVLMVAAVLVILTFTFQLTRMDIWQAKSQHFPYLFVFIPFQTFFPPKWFHGQLPMVSTTLWNLLQGVLVVCAVTSVFLGLRLGKARWIERAVLIGSGMLLAVVFTVLAMRGPAAFSGLYIPSGFSILLAMFVNLLAAHLTRFRIVGTRGQIAGGCVLMSVGIGLATAVIWNGQNPEGFQSQPPIPWTTLWSLLQGALVLCAATSVFLGLRLGQERWIERAVLIGSGLVLAVAFTFLAVRGSAAFIGDSAMRILWQLLQCLAPSFVILLGARQVFGRKAGVVLIHAGIAILMLNEIYTSVFTIEQRIQFFEGDQVNYAIDLRHSELALVDLSDPQSEQHVVVPESRLVPNQLLQHPDLPVDLMVVDYFRNSTVGSLGQGESSAPASAGIGQLAKLRELPPVSGTGDEIDQAGAYVKIFDKQTRRELGTYLVSQSINAFEEARRDDPSFPANVFSLGDRRYHLSLRFKRYYKPYTLTLKNVEKESYLGTETARHFSSEFRLADSETGIDVTQKVWMNNPLRYRNETFYQANYDVRSGREVSELQVVKNSGWMIPYFCCVFVGLGLVVQFGQTLVGYTKKLDQRLRQATTRPTLASPWIWLVAVIPLLIVAWGIRSGTGATPPVEGMRIDRLGRAPIVHLGRAKPLDSVARSLVRRSSGLESVRKEDGESTRIDALTWTADAMFQGNDFKQYQLFKIDDPNLRSSLGLEPRKRYRYSIAEVEKAEPELLKLREAALGKPEEQLSAFDRRSIELTELLFESRDLARLLQVDWDGKSVLDLYFWTAVADANRPRAMLIAPLPSSDVGWGSLSVGLFCQEMLDRAKQYGVTTCSDLAQRVVQDERDVVRDYEIRLRIFRRLTEDDQIRVQAGGMSPAEWQKIVFDRLRHAPMEELQEMAATVIADVDGQLDAVAAVHARVIAEDLRSWLGNESLSEIAATYDYRGLVKLREAYLAKDAGQFNERLDQYLNAIAQAPPSGFAGWKQAWESYFNRFSPFYLATIFYLAGFVLTALSWMIAPIWLRRIATSVLFGGWILHLVGIVMSVGISGRAPVTGLYSSFVFVTAIVVGAFMLIERLTRMGLGNLLGSMLGVAGLLWAWNIALGTEDTFAVLVAVLDTNFWLSTHVICVTLGYSATLAAGTLGAIYILNPVLRPIVLVFGLSTVGNIVDRTYGTGLMITGVGFFAGLGAWLFPMFRQTRQPKTRTEVGTEQREPSNMVGRAFALLSAAHRQELPRLIYGTVCFGLLFSFVGTVLGGLWADDSWGRFWGWDPKENGALMIVLWNAVVLHARWGGLVRQRGLAALAVLGNAVTAWSWEGVNQLGVGLHAYALSDANKFRMLVAFWLAQFVIAGLALIPIRSWWSKVDSPETTDAGLSG